MVAASARPGQCPSAPLSSRLDGPLPSGVRAEGDTLGFPTLTTDHSGTYVCHVSNELSSRDAQVVVDVLGKHWSKGWDLGQGPGGGQRGARPRVSWESVYLEGAALSVCPTGSGRGGGLGCVLRTGWGGPESGKSALGRGLSPAGPADAPGKQVDVVSASVVVVGVIAALLVCLLVAVVVLMSRYHRRKAQQMTQK